MPLIKRASVGLLGVLLLLALVVTNAFAIPPNPHLFYGSITAGGSAVPVGAVLKAIVHSTTCGQSTISTAGQYAISVAGKDPDNPGDPCQGTSGDQVTFRLSYGGQTQDLSPAGAMWQSGATTNLNLAFPGALPTPTPTNTPPPATNTPTPTRTLTPSPTPETFTRAFRGFVYNAPPYEATNPQAGVTVTLYGSYSATDLGSFLRTNPTNAAPDAGKYNLTYVVGSGADFTYYNIVMNDPNWTSLGAQSGSGGIVKAANWIQFVRPSTTDLIKFDNKFWVSPASPGGTATPTPTSTASPVAPTSTATPTATATPTGPTATLCLHTYSDTNDNGRQDEGEPALPGVAASVQRHSDGSAVADGVTAGDGRICWTLVQGQYRLLVTVPAGMEATSPTIWGVLLGGSGTFDVPLGFRPESVTPTATPTTAPGTGRIQGRVWEDRNQDQAIDPDEPGIAGVAITLRQNNAVLSTTTSAADGSYTFFNITLPQDPTTMMVSETDPPGYVSTTPNEVSVQVSSAYPVTVHFGDVTSHLYLPMLMRADEG
ncbi:MAG: hypothetical protein M5U01_07705 [Ardenticatenaceae bacterium]|nr:hypothetical protein [Ardenticatenaceae bacterium]